MICTKCDCDCCGFPTGDPDEDVCSDCAFPMLKHASEYAAEAMEINHWRDTGETKSTGELLRKALGM
jgi:hypothetical protein